MVNSSFGKAFEEQTKAIEEQGKKVEALNPIPQKLTIKDGIPENTLSEEAKNVLNKIKEIKKTVDRWNLYYRTNEYTYSFQNFRTISTFGKDIYDGTITIKEVNEDQIDLSVEILNFRKQVNRKINKFFSSSFSSTSSAIGMPKSIQVLPQLHNEVCTWFA